MLETVLSHLKFHFAAESDDLIPVPPRILNVVVVCFVVVAYVSSLIGPFTQGKYAAAYIRPNLSCKQYIFTSSRLTQAADNLSRGVYKTRILSFAYKGRGLNKTQNHSYKWYRGLFAAYVRRELTLRKRKVFPIPRLLRQPTKKEALVTNKP